MNPKPAQATTSIQKSHESQCCLETGSPAFPMSPLLNSALATRFDELTWTEYAPLEGLPALRAAIAEFHQRDLGYPHEPEQILVTYGAMQAIYNLCQVLLEPADEVLLPAPFWFHFPRIVGCSPGVLRTFRTDPARFFQPTAAQIEAEITDKTRLLILNNPHNPTGALTEDHFWRDLADVLRRHPRIYLLLDEAYNLLTLEDDHQPATCPLVQSGEFADRILIVNSLSKNFGLAGLRTGYLAAPHDLCKPLAQQQRFSSHGSNLHIQHAALRVMTARTALSASLMRELRRRLRHARQHMTKCPQLKPYWPRAGYYFWTDLSALIGARTPEGQVLEDGAAVVTDWCDHAGVKVQSGHECGEESFCRITFAVEPEVFEKGMNRLAERLATYDFSIKTN